MKINMKAFKQTLLFSVLMSSFLGCGTNDVISMLGSGNNSIPQLDAVVASGYFTGLSAPFTTNSPYWIFSTPGTVGSYFSPADGRVVDTGTATLTNGVTATYITIIHSGRVATRLYGAQLLNVRPGDAVVRGQNVGTYVISSTIGFQVLLDNVPVCPFSFISDNFKTALNGAIGAVTSANLCR